MRSHDIFELPKLANDSCIQYSSVCSKTNVSLFIYRFVASCFQALSNALSGLWQIDETDISGEIFSR